MNPTKTTYRCGNCLRRWRRRKGGLHFCLALKGRAKEAVHSLKPDDLNVDEGLDLVIAKLDEVFLKDKNTRAYLKFQEFYGYKRLSGETIDAYIVKFEQLYQDLTEFNMVVPSEIKACFLLMGCNISDDVEKLARATSADLTYDNVKDQIKKICGMSSSANNGAAAPPIKEECLFTANKFRSRKKTEEKVLKLHLQNLHLNPDSVQTMLLNDVLLNAKAIPLTRMGRYVVALFVIR